MKHIDAIEHEAVVHPDDIAINRFADAMKAKMAKQRAKGYGGWNDKNDCPTNRLQQMLVNHISKGDPVDVANFAMMLWSRGERTEQPAQQQEPDNQYEVGTGCECANCANGMGECQMEAAQQQAYEDANPLGGPAKVFQAMADAIRAGDSYHAVLRQYGYAEAQQQEPVRDMPHGWIVNWPHRNGGTKPVYHASAVKPKFGEELDSKLTMYPVYTRTSPPASKPWVGIDAGDWNKIAYTSEFRSGADWAEAKLREKNAAPCKPLTDEVFISMMDSDGICIDPELAFTIKVMVECAHGIYPENSDCHDADWTDRDGEYLK